MALSLMLWMVGVEVGEDRRSAIEEVAAGK